MASREEEGPFELPRVEGGAMEKQASLSSKEDPELGSTDGDLWKRSSIRIGLFPWLRELADHPLQPRLRHLQKAVLVLVCIATWWAVAWVLVGDAAAPHGQVFILGVLYVSAISLGAVASLLGTHPLIGMMAAGFICRFIPFIRAGDVSNAVASAIRSVALVVILLRAGLGLDLKTMRKHGLLCAFTSLGPTAVEVSSILFLCYVLLSFPWKWGAMTGFLISGVSPAVVVPALLQLQEKGYGAKKGIPALVLVASALDDVYGIAGFFIFHDIIFGDAGPTMNALRVPLELVMGFAAGAVFGIAGCLLCPSKKLRMPQVLGAITKEQNGSTLARIRSCYSLGLGLMGAAGGKYLEYSGAGALSVIVMGTALAQGWGSIRSAPVKRHMKFIWDWLAMPLLFVVIGAKLDPSYFSGYLLWKSLVIIPGSLVLRVLSTIAFATGSILSMTERVFVALAWAPKATVQAALCAIALNSAKESERRSLPGSPREIELGEQVFALAAMAIILTAPLGAMFLKVCGPRMLQKEAEVQSCNADEQASAAS